MSDILSLILAALDAGQPFALATVLSTFGSTPREAGTKAIITSAGTIQGTIGGGLLENHAQKLAIEALRTGEPAVFDFRFSGQNAAENEPVCGGQMRILVDPAPGKHREAFAAAVENRRLRRRGVLVTQVGANHLQITLSYMPESAADPAMRQALAARQAISLPPFAERDLNSTGEKSAHPGAQAVTSPNNQLIEPIIPPPRLLMVGGGHVGQALAHAAALIGLDITLIEDRPAFAEARLFPPKINIRCGNVAEEITAAAIDPDTYVALVSRGHIVDGKALAACIASPAAYLGMMGSRRKIALMRKEFIESGKATEDQWARLHAPIGLDIGAETPEEIAAAIVAQIIGVMRKASARPPSTAQSPANT